MTLTIPQSYYDQLAHVESGNNPFAKAPTSSASGLYQFTKSTWESLGFNWTDRFNTSLQDAAITKLTTQNATALANKGIDVTGGSLYGAHFLGASTAAKVYSANDSASIADIVGSNVMKANSFLNGMNVSDFKDWASSKVSTAITTATDTVKKGGNALADIGKQLQANAKAGAEVAAKLATGDVIGALTDGLSFYIGGGKDKSKQSNPLSDFLEWIKNLFSAHTAARVAAVIIGFILIAAALYALSNADKILVDTLKTASKTALV